MANTNFTNGTVVTPEWLNDANSLVYAYKPAIGSGIARSGVEKLRDWVSVKDFGAIGDGITDDQAAFNNAVTFLLSNGGGTLFVPKGQYLNVSLNITGDKVRIVGDGRGASILLPAVNTDCIVFSFVGGEGWGVENLSIKYPSDGISGSAIKALSSASGEINNVHINRCFNGIELGNSQATRVSHCEIWYYINYGLFFNDNCNDVYVSHCFLNGASYGTSTPNTNSFGIYSYRKNHALMMSHVEIILSSRPFSFEGSSTTDVNKTAFSTFTDCFFDSSSNAANINYTRNLKFVGCWFSQRDHGCFIANAVDTKFIGCSFVNNDLNGCIVQPTCKHTTFTDCSFDSNGQRTSNAYHGLVIGANTSDWAVVGGSFGNFGVFPQTQSTGITIVAGISDRYRIEGVNFDGNLANPLVDGGTGTNKYIQRNINYRTENGGTRVVTFSGGVGSFPHSLSVTPNVVTAFVLAGGATECSVSAVSATTITLRNRNTTTDGNADGNYNVIWSAKKI